MSAEESEQLNAESTGASHPVDADQLLHAVERVVSAKIQPLLESKSGVVKRKPEDPRFRFKGNRMQYDFNIELLSTVRRLERRLEEEPPNVSGAKAAIEGCRNTIHERNKLIRMADRSAHGWATVDEYVSDDLASDSDDEKRIRAAEDRAAKKSRGAKGSLGGYRQRAGRRGGSFYHSGQAGPFRGAWGQNWGNEQASTHLPGPSSAGFPPGPYGFQGIPYGPPRGSRGRGFSTGTRGSRGACHRCGDPGHFIAECPFPAPDTQ